MNGLFYNPTRVYSGRKIAAEFDYSQFGRRALIVCGGQSARLCGALDDVKGALIAQGIPMAVFDKVEQNPTVETCYAAGKFAREEKSDFVIAIGGGSPLDAAKAAANYITVSNEEHAIARVIYDLEQGKIKPKF